VTNDGNQIWRWTGTQWQLMPGAGRDIAVGADGSVFVVGMSDGPGGGQVYRWNPSINNWNAEPGVVGSSIAAGPAGIVYVGRSADSGLPVLAHAH
jgi:hypothetical protein